MITLILDLLKGICFLSQTEQEMLQDWPLVFLCLLAGRMLIEKAKEILFLCLLFPLGSLSRDLFLYKIKRELIIKINKIVNYDREQYGCCCSLETGLWAALSPLTAEGLSVLSTVGSEAGEGRATLGEEADAAGAGL